MSELKRVNNEIVDTCMGYKIIVWLVAQILSRGMDWRELIKLKETGRKNQLSYDKGNTERQWQNIWSLIKSSIWKTSYTADGKSDMPLCLEPTKRSNSCDLKCPDWYHETYYCQYKERAIRDLFFVLQSCEQCSAKQANILWHKRKFLNCKCVDCKCC